MPNNNIINVNSNKISPVVRAALGAYIKVAKTEKKLKQLEKEFDLAILQIPDDSIDIYYDMTEEFDKKFYKE